MVRKSRLKSLVVAVTLALSPMAAFPAGMGKLTVFSALGQPLRAEIELYSVAPSDVSSLAARMASPDAFRDANLTRSHLLSSIKFSVEQRSNGQAYIKLTSSQPIQEPFLDLLVELDWPAGRLTREYTMLLDPPGYGEARTAAAPAPTAPVEEPAAKSVPVRPERATGPAPQQAPARASAAAPKQAARAETAGAAEQSVSPASYGPVKKGDTLRSIAGELKPEGASLDQMLVSMFQSNKQAFTGGNMNRLKVGQILRVPETSEVTSVEPAQAAREVKVHAADWNAYRQRLAAAVAAAPEKREDAQRSAAGKITTAVEDKAAAAKPPQQDVLKLSKGEAPSDKAVAGAGGKGKQAGSVEDKLRALQEEAVAREKTVAEANARIAELEKTIKEMQRLLELKNQGMADLQKQAAGGPQPAPAAAPAAQTPKAPEAAKPAAPAGQPVQPQAAPAKAPAPAAKPAPKPEPTLTERLLDNPLYLSAAGLVALLLGALGYRVVKRRRDRDAAGFEESVMTGSDFKANTVIGSTAGGLVDTGDTSFLTDFSQSGMGTIDTNDVDPIAEAEVYMAYGRDVQAEEILKEAMARDPQRYEIHLKLLEIYAARKNLNAFETLASELYAALGGEDGGVWDKAARLGAELDPDNPLYKRRAHGSDEAGGVAGLAAAAVAGGMMAGALPGAEAVDASAAEGLDFNLGPDTTAVDQPGEAPEPEDATAGLDFILDTGAAETPVDAVIEPAAEAQDEAAVDFDLAGFDLNTIAAEATVAEPAPAQAAEPVAVEAPTPEANAGTDEDLGLDFDFSSFETAAEPAAEPVEEVPAEAAPEPTLDLSDLPATEVGEPAVDDLDMDLSLDEEPAADAVEEISAPAVDMTAVEEAADAVVLAETAAEEEPVLDFDLGAELALDVPDTAEDGAPQEAMAVEGDADVMDFDLSAALASAETEAAPEIPLDLSGLDEPVLEKEHAPVAEALSGEPLPDLGEEVTLEPVGVLEAAAFETTSAVQEFSAELPAFDDVAPAPVDALQSAGGEALEEAAEDDSIVIEPPQADDTPLDLDFDVTLEEEHDETPAAMPEIDLSGISLDMDDTPPPAQPAVAEAGENGADPRWEEVGTKLDLARAYMEMGDSEGAREILHEVMQEGDEKQRTDAESLLAELV